MTGSGVNCFEKQRSRDYRCRNKDEVLTPFLGRMTLEDPSNFTAVLMPNLYCSGLRWLQAHGVQNSNIFAVERSPRIHSIQKNPDPVKYPHLVGIQTTQVPMSLLESLDNIHASIVDRGTQINLFYLDFYGRGGVEHFRSLEKIFGLKMLAPNGTLIITLGTNRSDKLRMELQKAINITTQGTVAKFMVLLWCHLYRWSFPLCRERNYRSKGGGNQNILYTTSAFYFGRTE